MEEVVKEEGPRQGVGRDLRMGLTERYQKVEDVGLHLGRQEEDFNFEGRLQEEGLYLLSSGGQ